jgi:hypothetical protein
VNPDRTPVDLALFGFADWVEINVAATGLLDSIDALDLDHLDDEALDQLHLDLLDLAITLIRRADRANTTRQRHHDDPQR